MSYRLNTHTHTPLWDNMKEKGLESANIAYQHLN